MAKVERLLAAGADGCRKGWVVALGYGHRDTIERIELEVEPSAASLMKRLRGHESQPVLAADIPIGLPEFTGARECDRQARQMLGRRSMCVFNAPDRGLLDCESFAEVQKTVGIRKEANPGAKGLSKQGFNLGPKIREFDDLVRTSDPYPSWLVEVHPEVSFKILAGGVLGSKKKSPGKKARRALLDQAFPDIEMASAIDKLVYPKNQVAEDDRLDACIALWSGMRFVRGEAATLGGQSDAYGIPMRIVA